MSRPFRTKKDLVNLKVLQQTKQVQKKMPNCFCEGWTCSKK